MPTPGTSRLNRSEQLLALISTLYAAPGGRDGWRSFLEALCAALDGSSAQFVAHDAGRAAAKVALSVHLTASAIQEYADHWGAQDPWVRSPKARLLMVPGAVIPGEQLVSAADLRRTAYYNEYGVKHGVTQALGCVVEASTDRLSFLAISGDPSRQPFGPADVQLLRAVVPHIERALQLHRRVATADGVARSAMDALDRGRQPVLMLDANGHLIAANRSAETLLRARDGLVVDGRELRASSPSDTALLRACIASAIATSRGTGVTDGGRLTLGRSAGRSPLRVAVAPQIGGADPLGGTPTGAMLLVTDAEAGPVPDEDTIRAAFDLTPAEARLARTLAKGLTVAQAAADLGLAESTVRTRLKTVFAKTQLHRQVDLVRAVMNL